ncbi:hypothetical protein ABV409_14275 [Flagellimonas sp. DF-77]|uniref:hypothetical protein n=1 Tax=Flagellimonas algarum TaxID=3230298 RepID=UPI00339A9832
MLAGHYATALIAKQKAPAGSLPFYLIMSQLPDLFWLVFHFLGLEHTEPRNVLDVSLDNLSVNMMFSHDLLPIVIWMVLAFFLGKGIFKSNRVGWTALLLIAVHAFVDYVGGYPHNIFGTDTLSVGTGLYYSMPYLGVFLELLFTIGILLWFFRNEMRAKIARTKRSRNWIIGIFTFNILFLFSIADLSTREFLHQMNIDITTDFSVPTTMPILIIMYALYIYLINSYGKILGNLN